MKMGSEVSLVHVESTEGDIKRSISKALSLIDFKNEKSVASVVIKPNLCYYWDAYTGYTTDPRIVGGIIDTVREMYGGDLEIRIAEADATAMRTKYAFRMLGYEKLAQEKNVELFNLSKCEAEDREVDVNGQRIEFKIPLLLLESDLFVNVPKLKEARETQITCAMKNVFGCIASPRKIVYHPILNEAIVGMNKVLQPHLSIVDGLVALGKYPTRLNLTMAGSSAFSVDCVACQVMGYDPSRVPFLKMAVEEGLGSPEAVSTCGADAAEFMGQLFPKHNHVFASLSWKAQIGLLRLYRKIVGDITPPVLDEI